MNRCQSSCQGDSDRQREAHVLPFLCGKGSRHKASQRHTVQHLPEKRMQSLRPTPHAETTNLCGWKNEETQSLTERFGVQKDTQAATESVQKAQGVAESADARTHNKQHDSWLCEAHVSLFSAPSAARHNFKPASLSLTLERQ